MSERGKVVSAHILAKAAEELRMLAERHPDRIELARELDDISIKLHPEVFSERRAGVRRDGGIGVFVINDSLEMTIRPEHVL